MFLIKYVCSLQLEKIQRVDIMTSESVAFQHLFKISLNGCHGKGNFMGQKCIFGEKKLYLRIHMKYLSAFKGKLVL